MANLCFAFFTGVVVFGRLVVPGLATLAGAFCVGFFFVASTVREFNQAFLNRNQFKPFYEAEKVLFNNPQSFSRNVPNEEQLQELREDFNFDVAEYRDIGSALQFMNTPTEQKRLFEFGDTPHAERYREMLSSLNQDQ